MSRRSHIVRTNDQSQAIAAHRDGVFTWNAMLVSTQGEDIADANNGGSSSWRMLPLNGIRHTSLGAEEDFDSDLFPAVRIRIPRDGIYSISGRSEAVLGDANLASAAYLSIEADSDYVDYSGIDRDRQILIPDDDGGNGVARLGVSHAGHPFKKGDLIWLAAMNASFQDMSFYPAHLSVTYEAKLGTVYNKAQPQ